MSIYVLLSLALAAGAGIGFSLGLAVERRLGDARYWKGMEMISNLLTIGAAKPEARKLEPRVSAERTAVERVRRDRIENAAAVIVAKYQEKGMQITDEEARLQATAMLNGQPIDVRS